MGVLIGMCPDSLIQTSLDYAVLVTSSDNGWPTLAMANDGGRFTWSLVDQDERETVWPHRPRLATDDLTSLHVAVVEGLGVALLPRELVSSGLQAGRLQQLLPDLSSPPGLVHAVFPSRRGMVPAVRHLLDSLVAGYEKLSHR